MKKIKAKYNLEKKSRFISWLKITDNSDKKTVFQLHNFGRSHNFISPNFRYLGLHSKS